MSHPLFAHFPALTNHPLPARPVHPSSPRYYVKLPNEANSVVSAESAKTCVSIPRLAVEPQTRCGRTEQLRELVCLTYLPKLPKKRS